MTDLPALREAVAETVPYCGQGETVPNAWARRERAERILLDAVPALLDEVEAATIENTRLHEAFKVMEKEYNTDEAGLCERCTLNPSRVCLGCATFAEDEP